MAVQLMILTILILRKMERDIQDVENVLFEQERFIVKIK